jgi:glucokinase-like ROK family protein
MPQQSRYRTGDQALVRQMNLSVIMHDLRENEPISRAALAEMTGLNKTTVSSLVHELIERRFVEEFGLNSAGTGRPAMLLRLNPNAGCIVAAEIGVDFVSVIRTDFSAEITWRHREATGRDMGQPAILDRVLALLSEATQASFPPSPKGASAPGRDSAVSDVPLLGMAVGVPGLVDEESGTVLFAPNLGWTDVALWSLLRERFDAPIYVDNEANLAALGEYYFGAAQGYKNVLFLSLGVGLGGGIVQDGKLYRGSSGFGGEFGHMTMDPDGLPCNCGNRGCWETQVSSAAVLRTFGQAVMGERARRRGDESPYYKRNPELLTLPMVLDAARGGDAAALQALSEVGRHLGIGVASLVNALNPDLVVLGGRLSAAGEFLLPAVGAELRGRALRWNAEATQVALAEHGADACVMGGVAAVTQAVLAPRGFARAGLAEPGLATRSRVVRPGLEGARENTTQNGGTRTERTLRESVSLLDRQVLVTATEQQIPPSHGAP